MTLRCCIDSSNPPTVTGHITGRLIWDALPLLVARIRKCTPPSHAFVSVGTGMQFDKSVVQTDRSALPLCDMDSASQGDLYAGAAKSL